MNEQANTKLVQQAYENFRRGDLSALLGLLSPDVEWRLPEIENMAFTGLRRGRAYRLAAGA